MNMIDDESRKSGRALAVESFSRYQINRSSVNKKDHNNGKLFLNSFREIRSQKRKIRNNDNIDNLPGISSPLKDSEFAADNDQGSSPSIKLTHVGENISISSLGTLDKLKYILVLALVFFGKASLCPIILSAPQSIVPKLVWRCVVVVYYKLEKTASLLGVALFVNPHLFHSAVVALKDPIVKRAMIFSSVSFAVWLFCTVFAAHHTGLLQAAAISNSSILFYSFSRYLSE